MKLALGTVQLGMPYGIANRAGMPDDCQTGEILRAASDCGWEWVDTAAAYGSSEEILGRLLPEAWSGPRPCIATKIVLNAESDPRSQLAESLRKLRQPQVDALLLHNEADVSHARLPEFLSLAASGLAKKAGVSCYEPQFAIRGLDAGMTCLQIPCNLFDTRFLEAGVLRLARERNALVFARSIFLQGLFFLPPDDEKAKRIPGASDALGFLRKFCDSHSLPPAELAMSLGAFLNDAILVLGAESARQVRDNDHLFKSAIRHRETVERWLHERPEIAQTVFTPSLWPAAPPR